ncbi:hypothetical protein G9A89_003520 [Geosiphon pyriformis]|nr:hypothetical protein G9A89_003520 [Geosiphon pyriformis]
MKNKKRFLDHLEAIMSLFCLVTLSRPILQATFIPSLKATSSLKSISFSGKSLVKSYVTASLVFRAAKVAKGAKGAKQPPKKAGKTAKVDRPLKKKGSSFKTAKKTNSKMIRKVTIGPGFNKVNPAYYRPAISSNLNAMEPEIFHPDNVGTVYQLPESISSKLKAFGIAPALFKEFDLFPRPSLVLRNESVKLVDILDSASEGQSSASRYVITGPLGTGKSALLLQAVVYTLAKRNWIVIYISNAISYVNSSSAYQKNETTKKFVQPQLSQRLLQQIQTVNKSILQNIKLSKAYQIQRYTIEQGTTMLGLLSIGIKDQKVAFEILDIFLGEMAVHEEYPVLLAIDVINAFYRKTLYRNVDFSFLDASRLSLPHLLLKHFSGDRYFKRGAIIGATSEATSEFQSHLLNNALGLTEPSPWVPVSSSLSRYAGGLQRIQLGNYSENEAKGVFDFYVKASITFEESYFKKKLILSNGNPRKFYLSCIQKT